MGPNVKRWAIVDKFRETNALIKEYAEKHPGLEFINVFDAMLTADGQPRPEILATDFPAESKFNHLAAARRPKPAAL